MEQENDRVLDTSVNIADGNNYPDLYTQSTDKHLYVNVKLSHPESVKMRFLIN